MAQSLKGIFIYTIKYKALSIYLKKYIFKFLSIQSKSPKSFLSLRINAHVSKQKIILKRFQYIFFVCFNPFGLFPDYLQQHMSRSQEGLKFTEYKQNYSSGKSNFLFASKNK